jgi:arabinose-5-phosphate isomerase
MDEGFLHILLSSFFEYTIGSMKEHSLKRARFTLISAQKGLKNLLHSLHDLEEACTLFESRSGKIVVTGIGKSGAIGQKISATLTSLGHQAVFLHPVEAIHGDIGALSPGDVLLALSYSGESKEVLKLVNYAKKHFKVPVVSFTRSSRSSLGNVSEVCVPVSIEEEGSPENLAPMASTTAMLVLGDMLASSLASKNFAKSDFAKFHPGGALGLELVTVEKVMKQGRHLPIIEENQPLKEALQVISHKKLGVTAVVNKEGRMKGIITDGDIRRWILAGGEPASSEAGDVMTRSPKTILSHETLKKALICMERYKITTLFVVDAQRVLKGVLHIHDIIESNAF